MVRHWSGKICLRFAMDEKKIQRLPLLVPILKEISSIYRAILTLKTCQKPRHVWQKIVYLTLFFSTKSQVNSSSSETKVIWTMLEKKRISKSLCCAKYILTRLCRCSFWSAYCFLNKVDFISLFNITKGHFLATSQIN